MRRNPLERGRGNPGVPVSGPPRAARLAMRIVPVVVWVAWLGFWFWAFSFAFSDSFFQYDRHSRIPAFVAAWLGSAGILASAHLQWSRRQPVLPAALWHLLGVVASVCPLLATSALLSRAPDPWHLSGDDAMGVGIDFLMLCGVGAVSAVVLPLGLAVRGALRRRGRVGGGSERQGGSQ